MWHNLVRAAGACAGATLLYFALGIVRESRFNGTGLTGLAMAVSVSYAVAGIVLIMPWRVLRTPFARRTAFLLLATCSIVGLWFGFLPAVGWAIVHGAMTPLAMSATILGVVALLANLGLGVRDLLR